MDEEEQRQRYADRYDHYQGSAKIYLEDLKIRDDPNNEFLDPKNVARLVSIFELEGCLRLDRAHYIPVIIDSGTLEQALVQAELSKEALLNTEIPPELLLPFTTPAECLHGRHRLAAAKQVLLGDDKWWNVDIYTAGVTHILEIAMLTD